MAIFKQTLSFLKRSYPKPIIGILLSVFLISILIAYQVTNSEKANISQKIFKREQIIITKYDEEIKEYESQKEINSFKWRFEEVAKEPIPLGLQLSWDSELTELKKINNTPFYALWLENFITSPFFGLAILAILILPIMRALFLFSFFIKRQYYEIQKMAKFQKCVVGLLFLVLMVLILILLRFF